MANCVNCNKKKRKKRWRESERWINGDEIRKWCDKMDIIPSSLDYHLLWGKEPVCPDCIKLFWLRHPVRFYNYFHGKNITSEEKKVLGSPTSIIIEASSGVDLRKLLDKGKKQIEIGKTWDELLKEPRYPEDHLRVRLNGTETTLDEWDEEIEKKKAELKKSKMELEKKEKEEKILMENLVLKKQNERNEKIIEEYKDKEKIQQNPENYIQELIANNFEGLDWKNMEDLVGKLFKKKGYSTQVGVVSAKGIMRRNADFGIDVRASNKEVKIGIQVKYQSSNVDFDVIAKTLGVSQDFDKVIIISTKSGFTPQALSYASKTKNLAIWDSKKFSEELSTHFLNNRS